MNRMHSLLAFFRRLKALTIKEFRQIMRDVSTLLIGIVLPLALILIFGYGLSMDVKNAPVAVVMEDASSSAREVLDGLNGSTYFSPYYVGSMHEAENLMKLRRVDAIIRTGPDFAERLAAGNAQIQLILHGTDSSSALIIQGYVSSVLNQWLEQQQERAGTTVLPGAGKAPGSVRIIPRMWFNASNTSTWYLVPGLIAIIMTIVGAFLTSLVMAREWERGTLEALFVTPVHSLEILIAKMLPPFCIGMIGLSLCLLAATFLFHVPMEGSLWVLLLCTTLYLFVALGMGLFISALTRNQFLASQLTIVISFLPAIMLSGFLFDLRSVPLVVRAVGWLLPATYYIDLLKTLFLAGNSWDLIIRDCSVLLIYAVVLLELARRCSPKRLD